MKPDIFVHMKSSGIFACFLALVCLSAKAQVCSEHRILKSRIEYEYDQDRLVSSIHVFADDTPDEMHKYYGIVDTGCGIDSVETVYSIYSDPIENDTTRSVKSYDYDGKIQKISYFKFQNGVWENTGENYHYEYDSIGQLIREDYQGRFCSLYSYNDKNQWIGRRFYCFHKDTTIVTVDTVIFWADGLHATYKRFRPGADSDHDILEYYTYDENGNMVIREYGDTVNRGYRFVNRYNRKGRLKEELVYNKTHTPDLLEESTEYRYRHGLLTKEKHISYENGKAHPDRIIKTVYWRKRPVRQKITNNTTGVATKRWKYRN